MMLNAGGCARTRRKKLFPLREIKTAQVLFFPRHRIVRVILKGEPRLQSPRSPLSGVGQCGLR